MSIETRLNAINDHLVDDYSVLTLAGADLTNVDKNIINLKPTWKERLLYFINNGTDVVWGNWEKVVGEGTELTLSNTEQAPMKVLLKGNTYQDSTSGKNLFSTNYSDYNTTSDTYGYRKIVDEIPNGKYLVLSLTDNDTSVTLLSSFYLMLTSDGTISSSSRKTPISAGSKSTYPTNFYTNELKYISFYPKTEETFNQLLQRYKIQYELRDNITPTSYEPYTNGPSPNPSYPQDIHTVSGDNTIQVTSKDILQEQTLYDGYINSDDEIASATGWKHSDYIDITDLDYYIVDSSQGQNPKSIIYNANKQPIQVININNNLKKTYDLKSYTGAKYLRISCTVASLSTQHLIKQSDYQVNLPVKNLLDFDTILDYWGAVYTKENGTYTLTNRGEFYARPYTLNLEVGKTYTLSGVQVAQTSSNLRLEVLKDNNIVAIQRFSPETTESGHTFTVEAGHTYKIRGNYSTGSYPMIISKPQLEEGTKANTYTPYGTTPIELCKIGTYQDRFIRNSGKNLFNKDSATFKDGYYKNDNGVENVSGVGSGYTTSYVSVKPNTQYTISGTFANVSVATWGVYFYDSSKNWISRKIFGSSGANPPQSFTTPNNCYYIQFQYLSSLIDKNTIMLNEGTTALPYEPYGTGWYLKKETGKVVLDGETDGLKFTSAEISRNKRFSLILNDVLKQSYLLNIDNKSNYFTYNTDVYRDGGDEIGFIINSTQLYVRFGSSSVLDTITKANAWLSTHNTTFYYILATPTYTKIEGTLASQLEEVYRAKSEEGQTNISQVNNDLPFVLDVSALKEI